MLDPRDYEGHAAAWPAHVYARLKEAGFRLKPLTTIAPTENDVMGALEPPWQITRSPLRDLYIVQSD